MEDKTCIDAEKLAVIDGELERETRCKQDCNGLKAEELACSFKQTEECN